MSSAGISTPFAQAPPLHSLHASGEDGDIQSVPATKTHVQAAPSNAFTLEEGFFDSILPPSPSLDNLLNQGIVNMEALKNSSRPYRDSSVFSNGRSLSAMESLDLNWLQENPGNTWPTTNDTLQRQKSTAEVVMGSAEDYISSLSPLPAAPALRVPGQENSQAQAQAQAAYFASLQAAYPAQANFWPSNLGTTPLESVMFSSPYDNSATSTTDPTFSSSFSSTVTSIGLVGDPMFVPVNGTMSGQQQSFGTVFPSNASHSRADAMAQWAQEKALMQALSSSDMNAAVQAMSGALGAPIPFPTSGHCQNTCPFQVRIANKPTVFVAQTQPVKVSYPSSP